ncbi:MAG: hypothetical protein ACYCSF_05565 [Acidimicrobiales bacterium]
MWDEDVNLGRVRFLPAAWLERSLLDKIEPALDELVATLSCREASRCGLPGCLEQAAEYIGAVRSGLARHDGGMGEPCLLTKDAVFEMSELLSRAAAVLSAGGLHTPSLAVTAIDDRLVERIVELHPMAPA